MSTLFYWVPLITILKLFNKVHTKKEKNTMPYLIL